MPTYLIDEAYHRLVDVLAASFVSPFTGGADRDAAMLVLAEAGIWPASIEADTLEN